MRCSPILAFVAALGLSACGRQPDTPAASPAVVGAPAAQPSGSARNAALPQACLEAEAAMRTCNEAMAIKMEQAGQAAGARTLREALPGELEQTRKRWQSVPDRDGLATSCAKMRDGLRAQPQCSGG